MERPAAIWRRILAFIFDLVVAYAIFSSLLMLIVPELSHAQAATLERTSIFKEQASPFSPLARVALGYWFIFLLMYHTFCEYIIGQTAGMMLFNIHAQRTKESRKKSGNENLGFWQSLGRNLFMLPPLALLWLIEPLYYVFQGERLLEYWTKTETVE